MTPGIAPQGPQKYALPLIAFILSLVGLCLCLPTPVGLVLGIVAWVRISKEPQLAGKGLAIAATVIAAVSMPLQVIGTLSAIAIPNFIRFQARSKQSECKVNLRMLVTAEQVYFQEHDAYGTFEQVGFQPERGNRYSYFLGASTFPADANRFPAVATEDHAGALTQNGIETGTSAKGFVAACAGNVDNDATLDVWTVDEQSAPTIVVNDVEQ